MRRILKVTAAALALLFALAQFAGPSRVNPSVAAVRSIEHHVEVPPEVAAILERSCADCHSNRTDWPWYSRVAPASWFVIDHVNHGRTHMNLSDWARYGTGESADLLRQICRTARDGSMPLDSYTLLHRRARLTPGDVQALCDWAAAGRAATAKR